MSAAKGSGASDAEGRLEFLRSAGALLWPEPARLEVVDGRGRAAGAEEFLLLPGASRPRLLVPARARRAAAGAVLRYGAQPTLKARLRTAALAAATGSGALAATARRRVRVIVPPGAETITTHLSEVLGRPVLASMHLSGARANRKPVLQVLHRDGSTLAYVKVGVDRLTSALVAAEGAALADVAAAAPPGLTLPRVLHHGRWRGLEVLVLSPLPVLRSRRGDPARLSAAMVTLAAADGVEKGPLAGSPYWRLLHERLDGAPAGARTDAVRAAAATLAGQIGDLELEYGGWHGDWTTWNCAFLPDTVLLWDWERYTRPAPLGFDALHHRMQAALESEGLPLRAAADTCRREAETLLGPFGVRDAAAAGTARLYLLDLAVRYVVDDQAAAGARGGAVEEWLLPTLTDRLVAGPPSRGRS